MEPTDPPTSMNRNDAVTNLLDALTKLVGDLGAALAFLMEELREERQGRADRRGDGPAGVAPLPDPYR